MTACSPEPQRRSTCMPGTVTGSPASMRPAGSTRTSLRWALASAMAWAAAGSGQRRGSPWAKVRSSMTMSGRPGIIMAPGSWLQGITTEDPTDDMIEVAVAALEATIAAEPVAPSLDGAS